MYTYMKKAAMVGMYMYMSCRFSKLQLVEMHNRAMVTVSVTHVRTRIRPAYSRLKCSTD